MRTAGGSARAAALALACASVLLFGHDPALAAANGKPLVRHARRVNKFTSLSGLWSGVYRYSAGYPGSAPVPFNARIEECGEAITGEIDEPNTYAHPAAKRLYATVAGTRAGLNVSFIKKMDGTGGVTHSIFYEVEADSGLTRIDGGWRVSEGCYGTFTMERAGVEAEAAETRAASAQG